MPPTSWDALRANCVTSTESARSSEPVSFSILCWKQDFLRPIFSRGSISYIFFILQIGAFGEVRMCVHRESGAQRAVKVLRKSHMDDDEKRMLFNEINILKEIVSNIIARKRALYLSLRMRLIIPSSRQSMLTNLCSCEYRTTLTSSKCTSSSKTRSATI